jgi:rSAM/selenodomain-associated transferase 2
VRDYNCRVRLSIVIPTWNEAGNVARAVETAWRGGADEVLVVDGGSDDGTPEVAASLRCTLLAAPRGRASQQNAGAAVARGDVLLFLHADNWLAANDIKQQIAGALADPRRVHGAFRQQIDAPGLTYRWLEAGNAARARWLRLPYGDQAIFIRREAFEQAGGFPSVPLLEDLILMQRLRRTACPVLLPGPVGVSARRWQRRGVVRQTLRNWWLVARHSLGASPQSLAREYR